VLAERERDVKKERCEVSNENHTVRVHPTGMIFEGKCAVRGAACSAAVGIAPITAVRVEGTAETVNVCRACFEEQVDSRMWVVREVVRDNVQTAARVMQEKLDGLTAERDEARKALIEVTQKYVDAEARAAAVPPETAALYAQAAREVVVKGTDYEEKPDADNGFSASFRKTLSEGKYTCWAVNLTEEQIKTVLWAVGEFACRARDDDFVPVAMDADPPKVATWKLNHPRQLAALRILVQMRTSKRPTFDEALDTIRDSRALMDVLHLAKNIHIPLEPLTMPTTEPTPVTHEYPDVYDCGSWPAHGTEHGKDLPTICNELHAKGREVVQAWDHHGDGNRGWTVLHRARAK